MNIRKNETPLKFIYSEKATKFCQISTVDLFYVVPVKSKVKISQNFVAFSEYMNFNYLAPLLSCSIFLILDLQSSSDYFGFEILFQAEL